MKGKQALVHIKAKSLIPGDPRAIAIGKRLGWLPETVARRVLQYIPNPVEQQVYATIGVEFGMTPKKFSIAIRKLFQERQLREVDFLDKETGPGRTYSYGQTMVNEIRLVANISTMKDRSEEQEDWCFALTAKTAAGIVRIYGEVAEQLFNSIDEYLSAHDWGAKNSNIWVENLCKRIITYFEKNPEFLGLLITEVDELLSYLDEAVLELPRRMK